MPKWIFQKTSGDQQGLRNAKKSDKLMLSANIAGGLVSKQDRQQYLPKALICQIFCLS